MGDDDLNHRAHIFVQEIDDERRVFLLAERGEAPDIGEEDRHQLAAAGERDFLLFGNRRGELLANEHRYRVMEKGAALLDGQETIDYTADQAYEAGEE